jgi:methyltransferase
MIYLLFLGASLIITILEALWSSRNSKRLLQEGAIEIAPRIFPLMALLYVFLYIGSMVEYLTIPKTISMQYAVCFGLIFLIAKLLKAWAVFSLGKLWTMRVLILPGTHAITTGPYRYVKHPNYFAVLLEIAMISLAGKSIITFLIVFSLFSLILYHRVISEEQALLQHTDYSQSMFSKRRFIP